MFLNRKSNKFTFYRAKTQNIIGKGQYIGHKIRENSSEPSEELSINEINYKVL